MSFRNFARHPAAKILIVDDEATNVRHLERLLHRAGYAHVSSTTEPHSVPAFCARHHPDLLLLDLHMQEMNGLEVLRAVTAACAEDMPFVIMLTGDTSVEARLNALSNGARDFITKPFESMEVLLRINNLLDLRATDALLRAQNQRLAESVAARTSELEQARLEVIERLALAAEMRDDLTGHHIRRVGEIAARLARTLGMPEPQCEILRRSAPLHDIGKIGLPDRILRKRGPLTAAQRSVMQSHTVIGARLLDGSSSVILQEAQKIALSHHEWWNGDGYPHGLTGDDIPQTARIVAVADFYDALVHDRPYRAALSPDAALQMVAEGAGSHFDPAIVDAMLSSRAVTTR